MSRDVRLKKASERLGYSFEGEIKVGGSYAPIVHSGQDVYVSGQIPRVGDSIVVTGRAGHDVSLTEAQLAARICCMRALVLLQRTLGSLDRVVALLRVTVYVQCTDEFIQHSEVADAASELLFYVLGEAGLHSRTSVGVYKLPQNATVELDLIARVHEAAQSGT